MGTRHADRLWIAAGALVIALLTVVTWFLLVNPRAGEVDDLAEQTEVASLQAASLRKNTADLKAKQQNIVKLTAARDALQDALPSDSGVPAFLRQLQVSGTKVGVDVSGITVGTPEQEESMPGVWSLQIQLTAEGSANQLGDFLHQLQSSSQKRAVLIEAGNLDASGDAAADQSLSFTVKAFVAPPIGAGAPTVTTN